MRLLSAQKILGLSLVSLVSRRRIVRVIQLGVRAHRQCSEELRGLFFSKKVALNIGWNLVRPRVAVLDDLSVSAYDAEPF